MIGALQRTDTRCNNPPISPEDAEALKQLQQLSNELKFRTSPGREGGTERRCVRAILRARLGRTPSCHGKVAVFAMAGGGQNRRLRGDWRKSRAAALLVDHIQSRGPISAREEWRENPAEEYVEIHKEIIAGIGGSSMALKCGHWPGSVCRC